MVILARKCDELLSGQARFGLIWAVLTANDLQGQSILFSIGYWGVPRYTFGANLVILAQKIDELFCGQDRFGSIWAVLTPNDLEDQGQSTPSIGFWRVPRYTFGANLVILARKRDELSRGQAAVYRRTDRRTDAGNDNTPSAEVAEG